MFGRTNVRRALLLALPFALLPACGAESSRGAIAASRDGLATFTTLREAAEASGRFFGVAINTSYLPDSVYAAIADREFDMVTPEVEMYLASTEPAQAQFLFTRGDQLVEWAAQHGKRVHGYPLLSTPGQPSWLGNLSGASLRNALVNHVQQVVGHYQGKVAYWDVVVEAFNEAGSRANSSFERTGSDWIEVMFQAARSADPAAKLCYTDYDLEDWTAAKTQAVYAMVKDFKARGIPIDCVGIEGHFVSGVTVPSTLQTTLSTFAGLGVEVILNQLDVTSANASAYAGAVNACLSVAGCSGITVWGVRDRDSWRSSESPLLFDSSGEKKAAYDAVLAALNAVAQPLSAPTNLAWTNDGGTVTLTWNAPTGGARVESYELFFGSFDLGFFKDTSLALIGFKPGTPYTFTVKARDAAGKLSPASVATTVLLPIPQDTTPPSTPTNLSITNLTSMSLTLKWTPSTDDVGVVIYRVFTNGSLTGTTTSSWATLFGLSAGVRYSFTVQALDAAGNASPLSQPIVPYVTCATGCSGGSTEQ